jgi:hypothetical protein
LAVYSEKNPLFAAKPCFREKRKKEERKKKRKREERKRKKKVKWRGVQRLSKNSDDDGIFDGRAVLAPSVVA